MTFSLTKYVMGMDVLISQLSQATCWETAVFYQQPSQTCAETGHPSVPPSNVT